MPDYLKDLSTKRNIISLLILAIIILAIPLGVKLVRQQQLLQSLAQEPTITFTSPNVESRDGPNGPVLVATNPLVGLTLTAPWATGSITPTPTTTITVTPTPTQTQTPTPTQSATPTPTPQLSAPNVDLKVKLSDGSTTDGVVKVTPSQTPLTLVWSTSGSPTSCTARTLWNGGDDPRWTGSRNVNGGTFQTSQLSQVKTYIYTIDCSNAQGDAAGDSVTINVGTSDNNVRSPSITSLKANGTSYTSPISVSQNSNVHIEWDSSGTGSGYSVCITSGSWPKGYTNVGNQKVEEDHRVSQVKTYKFTVYCSNEKGFDQKTATINVQ